jgi:hypothetical protein
MENEKEKNRSATEWLTKPVYKILIAGLVLLELLAHELDGGMKNAIHVVMWIGLGWIVLINAANLFLFFGKGKKSSGENNDIPEEDN